MTFPNYMKTRRKSFVINNQTLLYIVLTGANGSAVHWIFVIVRRHVQQNLACAQNIHGRQDSQKNGKSCSEMKADMKFMLLILLIKHFCSRSQH